MGFVLTGSSLGALIRGRLHGRDFMRRVAADARWGNSPEALLRNLSHPESGREDQLNIRSFSLRRENPAERVRQTLTKPGGIFGYSSWLSYALSSDSRLELEPANTP
jgi:hypothetical protein